MTANLRLERDGPVARLLIDRADKRNAFDQAMWEALPGLVETAMAAREVRVLVLTSAVPGLFAAGADIGEFAERSHDPAWRARNQAAIRRAHVQLARAPKPVIAAIGGDCIGGGCGLALACDMRVASPRARLGITPAKLGLVYPLHDTKLLVDVVGPAQAKRILFTGGLLDSAEAHRIGLVDIVADDLAAAVGELTAAIAAASPYSQRASKAVIRRILDGATDDDAGSQAAFDAAFEGPDFREGVAAFLAKRKPSFPDA
jgi:enoyl-CoA hydratase/carnithine racemase